MKKGTFFNHIGVKVETRLPDGKICSVAIVLQAQRAKHIRSNNLATAILEDGPSSNHEWKQQKEIAICRRNEFCTLWKVLVVVVVPPFAPPHFRGLLLPLVHI